MFKSRGKVHFFCILIICTMFIFGCTSNDKPIQRTDKEMLIEKALMISRALYESEEEIRQYFTSNEELNERLIEILDRNKDLELKHIELNGYGEMPDKSVKVAIQIADTLSDSFFYYEYIFKKVDGEWILCEFGLDA